MIEIGRRIVETIVKVCGTVYKCKIIQTPSGEVATYQRILLQTHRPMDS